jgi:squalene monooxygenase
LKNHANVPKYFGALTIISDGYASKFRKGYIHNAPEVRSKFWGLELIDAELPAPGHGHVIISDGPPTLIYQIGTHETRILCDIPEKLLSASVANGGVKGHLRNVVLPSLPECVRPSFEVALEQGKYRSMPNSFLPTSTQQTPGLMILGDAMNMRHPLTGGGMTVAFKDVVLIRDLLSPEKVPALDDSAVVLKQMRTFHWKRKNGSSVINILAMALYSLFAAEDANLKVLQRGCFRYFQRGGACVDEPVSLLAGIIVAPAVLVYHFFAVAMYGIWVGICDAPPVKKPLAALNGFAVIWTAICVIGPYLISEIRW